MSLTTRLMIVLIVIAFFDIIIPIPLTTLVLIYVILERPQWFKRYVEDIYSS